MTREAVDDGWDAAGRRGRADAPPPLKTTVTVERARTIIARNDSPDIPFTQSINPYRGCEHGCIYCYARPTHAYLDLSPGARLRDQLFAKPECRGAAARRSSPSRATAAMRSRSAPTPIRTSRSSANGRSRARSSKCSLPASTRSSIVTKSALVERDIDILAPMAAKNLVRVYVSVTTLDHELARKLEPRAATPQRRLARDRGARRRRHSRSA